MPPAWGHGRGKGVQVHVARRSTRRPACLRAGRQVDDQELFCEGQVHRMGDLNWGTGCGATRDLGSSACRGKDARERWDRAVWLSRSRRAPRRSFTLEEMLCSAGRVESEDDEITSEMRWGNRSVQGSPARLGHRPEVHTTEKREARCDASVRSTRQRDPPADDSWELWTDG